MSAPTDPPQPIRRTLHVPSVDGTTKWVSGDVYTIKTAAAQTNGSLSFIVATVPPGNGPIAHIHRDNDEAFYLLDGQLEFLDGDQTFIASTGDFVFVPRGIRHRFRNISNQPTQMAFLFTPAGQERFMLEYGDDPLPGHRPQLWGVDHFTPQMLALTEELGTVFVPE